MLSESGNVASILCRCPLQSVCARCNGGFALLTETTCLLFSASFACGVICVVEYSIEDEASQDFVVIQTASKGKSPMTERQRGTPPLQSHPPCTCLVDGRPLPPIGSDCIGLVCCLAA